MEKLLGNSHQNNRPHLRLSQKQATKVKSKKPIKIKYISSPMMVRAKNALEFRAIVQELTGRNSNVTDLYDDVHDEAQYYSQISGLRDGDDQPSSWQFPARQEDVSQGISDGDHDHRTTLVHDRVDEKFSVPLLAQIDELGHYWRPEVSESFNGFQSPCVFVGQN